MTNYQLAKLILMAGGLQSRKRVQKTMHLLQAAGCPLDVDFRLHFYGPYSAELADLLDRMTRAEVLVETPQTTSVGTQYDYRFNEQMRESLECFDQTREGRIAKRQIEQHADWLQTLCQTDARVLELASTVVAFGEAGRTWDEAVEETADFKKQSPQSSPMTAATKLAQMVFPRHDG